MTPDDNRNFAASGALDNSSQDDRTNDHRSARRVRHELHFRLAEVKKVEQPTPHMVRVTVGGAELSGFTSPGFDDHCKLFFPDPQSGRICLPVVGPDGPLHEGDQRPIMRDYTPHSWDADALTLQFDFVVHEAGPASAWARQASPGQQLGIGGPRGSFILSMEFDWHLLIGDDTALPAISRRLKELPAGARAVVLLEVAGKEDEIELATQAEVSLHWIHRDAAPGKRVSLPQAAAKLVFPAGDYLAWVGCESSDSKALREWLIGERQANPDWLKAKSYWRRGSSDADG